MMRQYGFLFTHTDLVWLDAEDIDRLHLYRYTWHSVPSGRTVYARAWVNGRQQYLHRIVAGASEGEIVDHIDGDGLHCPPTNLRVASHGQNMQNSAGRPDFRRSRFKGVTVGSGRMAGRWKSAIKVDGRSLHLGYFPGTPEGEIAAARAYDSAAQDHFGEFARLNFPAAA